MIDVIAQVSAAHRKVGTRDLEAGEARTVTISQSYDTTVEDLWDACTNPERIPRWFLPVSGELRVGGRYQLEGNAGGTIERCDPPNSFGATWEFGDTVSWIEVRVSPLSDGQARLELEHTVPVDDHWNEFGPGAVGVGWELAVTGLALHLRSGQAVDPTEFAAWSASDDGERFMALSSQGWCDASIAAGIDAAEATARAARTTDAYTATEG